MLIPPGLRIFIAKDPADFRRSYDGLAGMVYNDLAADPTDGTLYVFFNKRRDQVKILYYHRGGLCIWMKRLERGKFASLSIGDDCCIELTDTELLMLIDGIEFTNAVRKIRYAK